MAFPLKLALLAVIVGCGHRAETHSPNESENESMVSKLMKLDHSLAECLNSVKSEIYELEYKTFDAEEIQKARSNYSKIYNTDPQICPCGSERRRTLVRSCNDWKPKPSGRYLIGVTTNIFEAYCEQELDGGGWTVIQNRYGGSENFNRDWASYRNGFGDLNGEFWLGLEKIHALTTSRDHELMVRLTDFNGGTGYAKYKKFAISGEDTQYELTAAEFSSGMKGLGYHKNTKFSTNDRDNDIFPDKHCAKDAQSGWWHQCTNFNYCNLNGKSQNYRDTSYYTPLMTWYTFKSYHGLKASKMMIREV